MCLCQSCIADQSLSWVRRSDQFIAMIWEKSSDQSSCLNLNLTFYLKLTSDHCAKCVTVIWCDLKIKAKVQVQAWTLIWTFFSDHRNELILIWTLWTIYNSDVKALPSYLFYPYCTFLRGQVWSGCISRCIVGCRQKIKKILPALFWRDLTQGSICRIFFGRRGSSSLAWLAF